MSYRILIGVTALAIVIPACATEPEDERSIPPSTVMSEEVAGEETAEAPSSGEDDLQVESTGSAPTSSTTPSTDTTGQSVADPEGHSTTSRGVEDDATGSTPTLPDPGVGLEHPKSPNTTKVVPPPKD